MNEIEQEIEGSSREECMKKLFALYGTDYKIKNTRNEFRTKGVLFKKTYPVVIVTYVVEDKKAFTSNNYYSQGQQSEQEKFEKNRIDLLAAIQNERPSILNADKNYQALSQQMMEIKSLVEKNNAKQGDEHESIQKIDELLSDNEFTYSYRKQIKDRIHKEFTLDQLDDFDLVERRVVDWIGETITIKSEQAYRPPHVVIIVGPTGIGKTTTLVKLAVTALKQKTSNNQKFKFCFITTDTMRVAAEDQLRHYAEVLDVKLIKTEKKEDIQDAFEQVRDEYDAIYIDTSGYSPNDSSHIGKLKDMLNVQGMKADVYLAVTASTKSKDLINIMKNYEPFGYNSVIITKCDESSQFGNVISVLYEQKKAISYVTYGQNAAGEIDKAKVVEFIKRLENFRVDRVHIEDKFGEK